MASERNRTEEKKTYTVGEIAEMLGISDKVAYTLVKSGQFKYVRVGRAIRVSEAPSTVGWNQINQQGEDSIWQQSSREKQSIPLSTGM